jgi:hypothetical protein
MTNIINSVPFVRTSRDFPEDLHQLAVESNLAYLEVAGAINNRTIGLFPANRSAVGGESWFITNQRQQNLRQIFTFTGAGNIPHNIKFSSVSMFTKPQGSYTDGTNYYGAIYASSVPIAGQVTFYVTPDVGNTPGNIVVLADAAAPAIVSGIIVLEWISRI